MSYPSRERGSRFADDSAGGTVSVFCDRGPGRVVPFAPGDCEEGCFDRDLCCFTEGGNTLTDICCKHCARALSSAAEIASRRWVGGAFNESGERGTGSGDLLRCAVCKACSLEGLALAFGVSSLANASSSNGRADLGASASNSISSSHSIVSSRNVSRCGRWTGSVAARCICAAGWGGALLFCSSMKLRRSSWFSSRTSRIFALASSSDA